LLENIVKHNQGNETAKSFVLSIIINENEILISNEMRPKINQNI
jgi:hypothetical protein